MPITGGDGDPAGAGTSIFLEAATRWTLLALIVVVPVTVMPGFTYDVYNVPRFGVFLAGLSLALGLYLFGTMIGSGPRIPQAAWIVPACIAAPLLISWVFSPYRGWALFGQYSRLQGLLPYLSFALFSVLIAASFRTRIRQLAWSLAIAGGLSGLGVILSMMGISATGTANQAGTLGNSNYAGGFLAITLPFAVHLWLSANHRDLLAMATTVFIAAGLILSFSQGGQAAALAAITLLIGLHIGTVWARRLSLLAVVALALIVVGIVALNFVRPVGGYTAMTRSQAWATALAMGTASPLTGAGPNALALEAPRFRSLEDSFVLGGYVAGYVPIGIEYQTTDDPHSVPLHFYANAGLLGLVGIVGGWGWTIRRGLQLPGDHLIGAAFFAASVAYLIQALISIDEPTLRLGFWAAVGGLVAANSDPKGAGHERPRETSRARLAAGAVVALLAASGGIGYGIGFIHADHKVRSGRLMFGEGRIRAGTQAIRSALAFREESLYREVLAGLLGLAALEEGEDGDRLIEQMKEINVYLTDLPDVGAIHAYARIMSYWGHYERSAWPVALDLYRRAGRLDPVNPLIAAETAEVLVDLGREREALSLLERLTDRLDGRVPEYWGALAITRMRTGDLDGAREALEEGVEVDPRDCRVLFAAQLLGARQSSGTGTKNDDILALKLNCEPGLYNMFLRRLPPDVRHRYT